MTPPAPVDAQPTAGETRVQEAKPDSSRTVLMVLYFFPPVGGISTSRNIRNVEHLPRSGWTPVVVTPREAAYEVKDPSLLALVAPTVEVIRTRSLEAGHVRAWVMAIGSALRVRRPRRPEPHATRSSHDGDPSRAFDASTSRERDGLLFRLRRFVFFPDDQVGWLPFALRAALHRHRISRVDVVYSTASPITSHLVAGLLKRRTGVPWVAEFRDPWLGTALSKPIPWLHRQVKSKVERWIIRTADQVVFLAPSTARMYQERYPFASNFVVIPNGYDRSETTPSARPRESGRFRIVYTGLLFRPIELAVFLEGLDRLLARRPELENELEVVFYGAVDPTCREIADRALDNDRLRQVVRFQGYVPRREALQAVADADAALVLLGAGPCMGVYIPGKLFDYLGQSQQILAMVPRGDAWDLLEELDWGVLAEPDPADVEHAIERVIALPRPTGPADPAGRYDRVVLARRLAETLEAAVVCSSRSRDRAQVRGVSDPTTGES